MMPQEVTAATRPVPWDGSFIPLPPHLCQPSQPLDAETVGSFLCERCTNFAKWYETNQELIRGKGRKSIPGFNTEFFNLYQNWHDFYRSYEKGCHLCTLIFACLCRLPALCKDSWNSNTAAVGLRFPINGKGDCLNCVIPEVCIGDEMEPGSWLYFEHRLKMTSIFKMSVATCSGSVLRLAATWIQNCIKHHHRCSEQFDTSFVPTRLVAILGENDKRIAKLETKLAPDVAYVALSYCWGDEKTFKLSSKNLEEFSSQGVPVDRLPRTMRHAVDLALHLGWQRIWIDALCIIQDDDEDWKHEASRMADVYSNSALTIAGWSASSCDQGLFTIRDPLSVSSCKIYDIPGTNESMFAKPPLVLNVPHSILPRINGPLYNRGWVVQERLFAPRTLNVGSFIGWECKLGNCSEFQPEISTVQTSIKNIFQPAENEDILTQYERIITTWNEDIVPSFTGTRLTRKSDRLVAISGAIQRLSTEKHWKNLHGLWEPFMVAQLHWYSDGTGSLSRRAWSSERSGAAPSWSWASIDGPVSYRHRERTSISSKVLFTPNSPTMNRTPSQIGAEDVSLTLKGRIYEMTLQTPELGKHYHSIIVTCVIEYGEYIGYTGDWLYFPDVSGASTDPHCWFLLLSTINRNSTPYACGLALAKVDNNPGKYERMGQVYGPLKHVSEKLRLQFDESPTHTITII